MGRPASVADSQADDDETSSIAEMGLGNDDDGLASADDMDWEDDDDMDFLSVRDNPMAVKEMRSDLLQAKAAGYRVGYLGSLTGAVIVSVSCRVGRLGISQEAMQAWNVRSEDFLVLLIRYPQGYRRLDAVLEATRGKELLVQMRVGLCDSYKPCLTSAVQAFVTDQIQGASIPTVSPGSALRPVFIGKALEALLNGRLLDLVRYRIQHGLTWTGAEHFFNDSQSRLASNRATQPTDNAQETWPNSVPKFLVADHVSDHSSSVKLSLPLLAMQYSLRRFVKCTEFCLNCWCKIDAGFEAIKPYVCSKSLCLFQYMQLGTGPSIEWEIRSQPYVVDMLISFAYARARSNELTDFPSGLGVKVPAIFGKAASPITYTAVLDTSDTILQLEGWADVKVGDWIFVCDRQDDIRSNVSSCAHYRVQDSSRKPVIQLSDPIRPATRQGQHQPPPGHGQRPVKFMAYNMDFDKLEMNAKREAILMLLDTLPSVGTMGSFLESGPNGHGMRPLGSWVDRVSPSALYVLRWIVASNRSCIMYDDDPKHQVSGMRNYLQFRLAQGAPDKEQRFVDSVKATSTRLKLEHPTLFAWHGSPLCNWHSILREGLHFKAVFNGRAFGNGVYMARDFHTSNSFSQRSYSYPRSANPIQWPHSTLNISTAISLNEVVNAPKEFTSSSPYYVVSNLDWIQPRYLFIRCSGVGLGRKENQDSPSDICAQDPGHRAHGPNGKPVTIPISALSSRVHQCLQKASTSKSQTDVCRVNGKAKAAKGSTKRRKSPEPISATCGGDDDDDDDKDSIATLAEDREFLQEDRGDDLGEGTKRAKILQESLSKTDFRPGTLQESSLKLFGAPKYATPSATIALQRRLRETLKVQAHEPLHELGWYIDQSLINTVYQWTAELHSFDPALPLAKDLKGAGLTSIVLEIRFPPGFPTSPPFVRVVRPRFRPFSKGGGGHVTAGGAMCMQLLTDSGWSPASSIESVLVQVRMAICSTEPWPARLDSSRRQQEYSVGEAVDAYKRASEIHGWQAPNDFQRISWL